MKRLVLTGAGHSHALALRALARQPLAGVEVMVVSPEPLAPYSGMVPGWLAGLYRFDDIVVDFPALAPAARRGALAVDDGGFIRIDAQLRSVSHPQVFATGDCASWQGHGLPKAGVHAVRMGPALASNLRIALTGAGDFSAHRPQRQFLALLAAGEGRAIASRGPFGAEGAWAWRWKDRIDRRFLDQFRALGEARRPHQHVEPAYAASAASTGDPS